ncbi:MAG: hypothetical protein NTY48_00480 [Candidatus Diapherotrites archaeon]|nr:hypothetical protein [Candidatus Diapherotrites archaeon]
MLKAGSAETKVNLFLKMNAPVKVAYMIGDAGISYFLAPRVESQ